MPSSSLYAILPTQLRDISTAESFGIQHAFIATPPQTVRESTPSSSCFLPTPTARTATMSSLPFLPSTLLALCIATLYTIAGQAHFTARLTPKMAKTIDIMTPNSYEAFGRPLGLGYTTVSTQPLAMLWVAMANTTRIDEAHARRLRPLCRGPAVAEPNADSRAHGRGCRVAGRAVRSGPCGW